ncbi:unnamed protein product, partial [marine sediment metagenome]
TVGGAEEKFGVRNAVVQLLGQCIGLRVWVVDTGYDQPCWFVRMP